MHNNSAQPVSFHNQRGLRLAGQLYAASSRDIVVFAHGFCGDRSANGRFERITAALQAIGLNCLTFDFAGCGESDDDTLNVDKEIEDLQAALHHVRQAGYQRIGLYGHSLGSLICLRCATPDMVAMVLSGALTGPAKFDWDEFFAPEELRQLPQIGVLTHVCTEGPRERVLVEARMLESFGNIDSAKLAAGVDCPVLIIHGDNDEEEQMLLARSRAALEHLPKTARIEIITGADHTFLDHLDALTELTCDWFSTAFDECV